MTQRLGGKVALITGTAGGQGRAAALAFAAEGASVAGADLKVGDNQETVALVRDAGGEMASFEPVDLGDPSAAQEFVDAAANHFGGVDIVYNNASAARFAPFPALTVEDWQYTIRNELDLVFYVSKAAWPHLVDRGGGVIINTASTAGLAATSVLTGAHSAAKGGVIALTRQMAFEGAVHGIRVVCISPGPVDTPGTADALNDPQGRAQLEGMTMLRRVAAATEIASVAAFLASGDASFMTGTNVVVDGGMTAT